MHAIAGEDNSSNAKAPLHIATRHQNHSFRSPSVSGSVGDRRLGPAFGVDRGAGLAAPGDRSRQAEMTSRSVSTVGFAAHLQTFRAWLGSGGCTGLRSAVGGVPVLGLADSRGLVILNQLGVLNSDECAHNDARGAGRLFNVDGSGRSGWVTALQRSPLKSSG
jgi:hypothetical protein